MAPSTTFSLAELAVAVNDWCRERSVLPANGQAAEDLSERSLRFYRTIGLLDSPDSGGGRGYGEKHLLQLIALRLLQGRGLPLRRIRELLQSRSLDELRRIRDEGLAELETSSAAWAPPISPSTWQMIPLNQDFLLLSRNASLPPPETLTAIRRLLEINH
jgi:DNA-binding transcriptional MerR regulator